MLAPVQPFTPASEDDGPGAMLGRRNAGAARAALEIDIAAAAAHFENTRDLAI